jgi:hypothetical protein
MADLVENNSDILLGIYAVHEELMATLDLACRAGCDLCCTRNVAVTRLEADLIFRHLGDSGRSSLLDKLGGAAELPRFQPLTTTNTLSHLCRKGESPPVETCDPSWRPCPFLSESRCAIYAVRPFACRCMVSKSVCEVGGQAEMDDYLLALQTVFMQFIEHADSDGCSGNLIDMLLDRDCGKSGFLPNRPIEMILLPPEYQERGKKIVAKLSALFQ